MCLSALLFQPDPEDTYLAPAIICLILGTIALGISMKMHHRIYHAVPIMQVSEAAPPAIRIHWRILILGIFLLLILAGINGNLFRLTALLRASDDAEFGLFCAGIALVALGMGGFDARHLRWTLDWREVVLVLAVIALAVVTRFWMLGEAIPRFVDEGNFARGIAYIRPPDNRMHLLRPGVMTYPTLYSYLEHTTMNIFGWSMVSFRAVSAVLGVLTVLALYLLAKSLFDRKTAVIAAVLLATFPPHLQLSRLALNNIAEPAFGTLALAFLARGLKLNRQMDYALGGVCLGLTQYFYDAGRLLYPPLTIAWLAGGLILWRPRPHVRGWLLSGMAALLVALPLYITLLSLGRDFDGRMDVSGLDSNFWRQVISEGQWELYLQRLPPPFLLYVHLPDTSRFYDGQTALLLLPLIPFFLLGVAYTLWRIRTPALLLPLALLATSLGNSLMIHNAAATRFIMVFPLMMLLAAVGIYVLFSLWPIQRKRYQIYGIALLVAGLAIAQTHYYFNVHVPVFNGYYYDQIKPNKDSIDAIARSIRFPRFTRIYLVNSSPSIPQEELVEMLNLLAKDLSIDTHIRSEITPAFLYGLPEGVDLAFFIEPEDVRTLKLLRRYFHLRPPQFSPFDAPVASQFVLYYAPYLPGYSEKLRSRAFQE